jgi:hypothetical protein
MDERKGFLLPEQEQKLHDILKLKGILGVVDGPLLKLLDNLLFEKAKGKIPPELLPTLYLVIDEIFSAIDIEQFTLAIAEAKKEDVAIEEKEEPCA